MNSKLNLWSDRKNEIKLANEEITQERIKSETQKCEVLFHFFYHSINLV